MISAQGTSVDSRAHERAHMQGRNIRQVTEQKQDEYFKGALNSRLVLTVSSRFV